MFRIGNGLYLSFASSPFTNRLFFEISGKIKNIILMAKHVGLKII
jgi:hypothetical protein